MIKLFEYEASTNQCRLATEGLMLTNEFNKLKELCDNKFKKSKSAKLTPSEQEDANELFFEFCKFLFLAYDIASKLNPYREYGEDDRIIAAKKDCTLNLSDYNEPVLLACIEKIKSIYEKNLIVKYINKCYIGLDKLGDYYEAVDFTLVSKTGELVHNANTLKGNLKESSNLVKTAQELRDSLNKELESDASAVRGGHSTGFAKGKKATK